MNSPLESDPGRLRSVDAYRGFVMLAMASGGIATFGCLSRTGGGDFSIPRRDLCSSSSTTFHGAVVCSGT